MQRILELVPGQKNPYITTGLRIWAKTNPVASLNWLEENSQSKKLKSTGQITILSEWAKSSPLKAAEWVEKLNDQTPKDALLAAVAVQWAQKDSDASTQWASKIGSEKAVCGVANTLAVSDPGQAVKYYLDTMKDQANPVSVSNLVYGWASLNPVAASAWCEKLTDSDQKNFK